VNSRQQSHVNSHHVRHGRHVNHGGVDEHHKQQRQPRHPQLALPPCHHVLTDVEQMSQDSQMVGNQQEDTLLEVGSLEVDSLVVDILAVDILAVDYDNLVEVEDMLQPQVGIPQPQVGMHPAPYVRHELGVKITLCQIRHAYLFHHP